MPPFGHDRHAAPRDRIGIDLFGPPMASPPNCTSPRIGESVPVSTFSSVLLPMPLRPSSASTSPAPIVRSMPNSTWLAP
jgi:hypothetical protein